MKLGVPSHHERRLKGVFVFLSLVALAASVKQSVNDTRRFRGFDYALSVVAGRAFDAGFDPYRTRLKTDDAGWPVKPAVPLKAYNRLLFAPTLFCVYAAIAPLPYMTQRFLWLGGSWAAFVGSAAILIHLQRSVRHRYALAGIAIFFFAVSDFWRRHLLQGKYYAFLMLLLAIGSWLIIRRDRRSWAAGVAFGIGAAFRPTIVIAAVPLWLAGRRAAAVATVAVAIIGSASSLLIVRPSVWIDSVRAVRIAERETQHGFERSPPEFVTKPEIDDIRVDAKFPQSARAETVAVPFQNVVLDVMILKPLFLHFGVPARAHWHLIETVLGGAVIGSFLIAFILSHPRRIGRRTLALLIVVSVLSIDFFLPERWSYNDVQYLLPLGLALPLIGRRSIPLWAPALLLVGLVAGHDRLMVTNGKWMALARLVGLLGGPALLAIWICLHRYRHRFGQSKTASSDFKMRLTDA